MSESQGKIQYLLSRRVSEEGRELHGSLILGYTPSFRILLHRRLLLQQLKISARYSGFRC